MDQKLLNAMLRNWIGFDFYDPTKPHTSYPPSNIIKISDSETVIEIAAAGFTKEEIEIIKTERRLTVAGAKKTQAEGTYLHRGIAERDFKLEFIVSATTTVTGASFEDGMLRISLKTNVSEKSQRIEIGDTKKRQILMG